LVSSYNRFIARFPFFKTLNMQKILFLLLIFFSAFTGAAAQNPEFEKYYKEGIRLYDAGNYDGAVEQYKAALRLDSNSALIHYEIALTYFQMKLYALVIDHTNKALRAASQYEEAIYMLKGSAQDLSGDAKAATATYRAGIAKFPASHLMLYNLAITLFNNQAPVAEVESLLQRALKSKPTHPSSHILMALLMKEEKKRVPALMAFYNFLLLEPRGQRAEQAMQMLEELTGQGVVKKDEKNINITLQAPSKNDDGFRPVETMLSLMEASALSEENKNKPWIELFTKNTSLLFGMLGEQKENKKGFWWEYYADFFTELNKAGYTKLFCYYISQSKQDETITAWLKTQTTELENFSKWFSDFKRK
jgi:predicted Zn-dependent protease